MKDIELPPLPDPKYIWHDADEPGEAELFEFEFSGAVDGRCDICERLYSNEQIQSYARAAIEADRAQRVPVVSVMDAATKKGPLWNKFSIVYDALIGREITIREIAWRCFLAASTPAPAQQERGPSATTKSRSEPC